MTSALLGVAAFVVLASASSPCGTAQAPADDVAELVEQLESARAFGRREAAEGLGAFGEQARPAVEPLVRRLEEEPLWSVRRAIVGALGAIGDRRGVDALVDRLEVERSTGVREEIAAALALLGGAQAERALFELLADPDDDVVDAALAALERAGAETLVATLFEMLSHDDADVRATAARALTDRAAAEVVDVLLPLLADAHPAVRASAAEALAGREPDAQRIVRALVPLLADPAASTRGGAARSLVSFGGAAVAPLAAAAREPEVCGAALATLLLIGGPAEEALRAALDDPALEPELVELLLRPDSWPAQYGAPFLAMPATRAALLLESVRASAERRMRVLRALREEAEQVWWPAPIMDRAAAWRTVAEPVDESGLDPGLRAALRLALRARWIRERSSIDELVQPRYARAWHEPAASDAELLVLFDDPDPSVRETAAWASALDLQMEDAELQRLALALDDPDASVRAAAVWALGVQAVELREGDWVPSWIAGAEAPRSARNVIGIGGGSGGKLGLGELSEQEREEVRRRTRLSGWKGAARAGPVRTRDRAPEPAPWFVHVEERLRALTADADADVRATAAWALSRARLVDARIAPALAPRFGTAEDDERVHVAEAIVRSGVAAESERTFLDERALEGDPRASRALARIGDQRAVRALLAALAALAAADDTDALWLGELIAGIRPIPRTAIEPLGAVLFAGHEELAAWFVLLGADGVPELVRALDAPSRDVRGVAIFALARLGADAAPALDALERIAAGDDATLAQAARESLATIRARLEER